MAAKREISIYQGDTYLHELRLRNSSNTAINITGRVYTAQLRKSKSSETAVSFTTAITNAANGVLTFSLTPAQTSNIEAGSYIYDLQELNGSIVTTLISGTAIVSREVNHG
jgi:seryl-tRNA(Sec) selenium transferase